MIASPWLLLQLARQRDDELRTAADRRAARRSTAAGQPPRVGRRRVHHAVGRAAGAGRSRPAPCRVTL